MHVPVPPSGSLGRRRRPNKHALWLTDRFDHSGEALLPRLMVFQPLRPRFCSARVRGRGPPDPITMPRAGRPCHGSPNTYPSAQSSSAQLRRVREIAGACRTIEIAGEPSRNRLRCIVAPQNPHSIRGALLLPSAVHSAHQTRDTGRDERGVSAPAPCAGRRVNDGFRKLVYL